MKSLGTFVASVIMCGGAILQAGELAKADHPIGRMQLVKQDRVARCGE